MQTVTYPSLIPRLLEGLPGIRDLYESRLHELYAEGNPCVIYGSILPEYVEQQMAQLQSPNRDRARSEMLSVFTLIETLASRGDFDTRCVVETEFLESMLLGTTDWYPLLEPFMGAETRRSAETVAAHRRA